MSTDNSTDLGLNEVEVIGTGQFLIESELGKGGGAVVWKAKEIPPACRDVAVKVLTCSADAVNVRKLLAAFGEEARIWAEFQRSPHVVQLYYPFRNFVRRAGEEPFVAVGFVMEYAAELDLGKKLRDGSPIVNTLKLSKMGVTQFLLSITKGIKTGHDLGIVHRDIKPSNVLLFKEGRDWLPKLMDFGISVFLENHSNDKAGTPEYMPPEILFGEREPSLQTDIFSLGILFYELLTGKSPFPNKPPAGSSGRDRREFYKAYWLGKPNFHDECRNKVQGKVDEDLLKMVLQMLQVPAEYVATNRDQSVRKPRPCIAEVEARLERLLILDATTISHTQDTTSTVRRNRYRWHPGVHQILGEELRYFFIKGKSLRGDPTWIANNLRARGLRGFSIYRVLGGFDHIVRVWVSRRNEEQIRQVFSNFNAYQNGSWKEFVVQDVQVLAGNEKVLRSHLVENDVLSVIATASHTDPDTEYKTLQNSGTAIGLLDSENSPQFPFRVFLGVEVTGKVSDWVKKWFMREVVEAFDNKKELNLSELSIYHGDGLFQFLIKFRTCSLQDLSPIMGAYLQVAAQMQNEDVAIASQTYVELPGKLGVGDLVDDLPRSDDGSIIDQSFA